jgi:hypothetical protein
MSFPAGYPMSEVPPPYVPPARVGMNPMTGDEVNMSVGQMLRDFTVLKEKVGHYQAWLAGAVLTDPPYKMDPDLETLIKSAVNGLDSSLDGVDMTFINRLVGIW